MKSSIDMVAIGQVANALPREGKLLPASLERKPKHFISPRAKAFWEKLCSWYGASKLEDFGEWPSIEICKAIDALRHRDDLAGVLSDIKQQHAVWPPSGPQLEAIIARHIAPVVNWPKLMGDLTEHILRTHYARMSLHQRIAIPRWNWYQDGVFVPASDGVDGFFVPFSVLGA